MSYCQQLNSNQDQYTGYNEAINKIYFNPYHNSSQLDPLHGRYNHMRKSGIPFSSTNLQTGNQVNQSYFSTASFKSEGQINDGNLKNGYQGSRNGRLSVSQIFNLYQMKENNQKQTKIQEKKPVINYFVTQFQRLQEQNKRFKKRIQQLEKGNSATQQSESNMSQMDLLYENQKIKKQLQQQSCKNREKNEKISQLMQKINQIEEHVELVVSSRSAHAAKQEEEKRKRQQKVLEEKKSMSQEINMVKSKYTETLENAVKSLVQKIKEMEGKLEQSVAKYKNLEDQVNNLNSTLLHV